MFCIVCDINLSNAFYRSCYEIVRLREIVIELRKNRPVSFWLVQIDLDIIAKVLNTYILNSPFNASFHPNIIACDFPICCHPSLQSTVLSDGTRRAEIPIKTRGIFKNLSLLRKICKKGPKGVVIEISGRVTLK